MKVPSYQQQLTIVTTLLRLVIWFMWLTQIALDAVMLSSDIELAMFWMPWVFIGLLYTWQMDSWIREYKLMKVLILFIPFMVLSDFVKG